MLIHHIAEFAWGFPACSVMNITLDRHIMEQSPRGIISSLPSGERNENGVVCAVIRKRQIDVPIMYIDIGWWCTKYDGDERKEAGREDTKRYYE